MTTCVFIQIRCRPGTTYRVAEEIALREIHSELYSTSGEYDLLMKLYIPKGEDVGVYINDNLLDIEGIERSLTTMTFKVFEVARQLILTAAVCSVLSIAALVAFPGAASAGTRVYEGAKPRPCVAPIRWR